MSLCPCGSFMPELNCCRPILDGLRSPKTAVALMRSRYSAFYWGESHHLAKTQVQPFSEQGHGSMDVEWIGLRILSIEQGGQDHEEGIVCFEASYRQHGRLLQMTERSAFKKINGRWMYIGAESP